MRLCKGVRILTKTIPEQHAFDAGAHRARQLSLLEADAAMYCLQIIATSFSPWALPLKLQATRLLFHLVRRGFRPAQQAVSDMMRSKSSDSSHRLQRVVEYGSRAGGDGALELFRAWERILTEPGQTWGLLRKLSSDGEFYPCLRPSSPPRRSPCHMIMQFRFRAPEYPGTFGEQAPGGLPDSRLAEGVLRRSCLVLSINLFHCENNSVLLCEGQFKDFQNLCREQNGSVSVNLLRIMSSQLNVFTKDEKLLKRFLNDTSVAFLEAGLEFLNESMLGPVAGNQVRVAHPLSPCPRLGGPNSCVRSPQELLANPDVLAAIQQVAELTIPTLSPQNLILLIPTSGSFSKWNTKIFQRWQAKQDLGPYNLWR